MAQFEIKDGVAIIPDGTTEIGNHAFEDCTSLGSITNAPMPPGERDPATGCRRSPANPAR